MIRHVSIPAQDPAHVAKVLARLMGGRAYPFPGDLPGAFMAVSGNAEGVMVEVYPDTAAGRPGEGDAPGHQEPNPAPPRYWPFHILMTTKLTEGEILAIGEAEGWRTRRFGRGAPGGPPLFHVVEMWIENRFLLELAPEAEVAPYERTYQFAFLEAAGIAEI